VVVVVVVVVMMMVVVVKSVLVKVSKKWFRIRISS
jgi:hypothetical protein